jgi:hypothetical protein
MPDRLIAAVRRVSNTKAAIERQRARIQQLGANGMPTEKEERLLDSFVKSLAVFEEHERALRSDIQKK